MLFLGEVVGMTSAHPVEVVGAAEGLAPAGQSETTFADRLLPLAMFSSFLIMIAPMKFFYLMLRTEGRNMAESKQQVVLLLPYLFLWVQGIFWGMWASLDRRPEITHLQQTGVSFYTLYCGCFCICAADAQKGAVRFTVMGGITGVLLTVVRGIYSVDSDRDTNALAFAYAGLCVNVLMYCVPFLQLVEVVRTGVVTTFPLPLCGASLLSAVLWLWHSWVNWAPIFFVANLVGALINGIQVFTVCLVYFTYAPELGRKTEEAEVVTPQHVPLLSGRSFNPKPFVAPRWKEQRESWKGLATRLWGHPSGCRSTGGGSSSTGISPGAGTSAGISEDDQSSQTDSSVCGEDFVVSNAGYDDTPTGGVGLVGTSNGAAGTTGTSSTQNTGYVQNQNARENGRRSSETFAKYVEAGSDSESDENESISPRWGPYREGRTSSGSGSTLHHGRTIRSTTSTTTTTTTTTSPTTWSAAARQRNRM